MRCHHVSLRFVATISLMFALATPALAQKTTGDITGSVTDATGGVMPGVAINAICSDTGLTRNTTTDAQGGYTLPELPVCVYKVTAELQGFKNVARDVQVAVNTVAKADFKMEVGAQSETVTVTGSRRSSSSPTSSITTSTPNAFSRFRSADAISIRSSA